MKQITKSESPIMDVVLNCTCAALDQTDCNYLIALFSNKNDEFKVANISLNIEDEKMAAEAFAHIISERNSEGKLLLRLVAGIIEILPEEIWKELGVSIFNGGVSGEISSTGIPSVGGGITL